MANLLSSSLTPLVIPSAGMSTRFPVVSMPTQFSPWIRDFDNESGYYESRRAVGYRFDARSVAVSAITSHPTNKNRSIYIDAGSANGLKYYDINGTTGDIGTVTTMNTSRARSVGFNKNAFFFFSGGGEPLRYDGTFYGTASYTGPVPGNVVFGFPYKSRMYLVEGLSSSVWYGTIGGVTGPTKQVDFSSLTQDAGIIMCGFSFTLSSGVNAESLFALVFDTGEMLVYSGNYPDDVSTWNIVATARVGSPVGYQSIIQENGDVLVITKTSIVSCRELLTTAQGNVQAASITSEIEKYWTTLMYQIGLNESVTSWSPDASNVSYITGAFHAARNKIVIFLPKYLSPQGISSMMSGYVYENAPAMLVYDIPTKSWVIHVPNLINNNAQYQGAYYWPVFGKLLFGSNDTANKSAWEYWGATNFRDEQKSGFYASYFPQLKTSFVSTGYKTMIKGVYITHQGQYAKGQLSTQIVGDSGAQYTLPQNAPSLINGVTRDLYSVGISAENYQISIGTSTPSDGSMNTPYRLLNLTALSETNKDPN